MSTATKLIVKEYHAERTPIGYLHGFIIKSRTTGMRVTDSPFFREDEVNEAGALVNMMNLAHAAGAAAGAAARERQLVEAIGKLDNYETTECYIIGGYSDMRCATPDGDYYRVADVQKLVGSAA